jgi:beta-glucanase (GH16 family)
MLGSNVDDAGWPTCGEIDIMENIGRLPSTVFGSLHAAGLNASGVDTLPNGEKFSDAFHNYAVEWEPTAIRFYVDGALYETQTPSTVDGSAWSFDHPFFILLDVAVGGTFPGNPDSTTVFPQTMKVDWVRVCDRVSADG